MLRYAWVGGSIWGGYAAAAVGGLYAAVSVHRRWKRFVTEYAPAFPVLIGNALDWLSSPTPPQVRRPGLATFDDGVATVTGPRGVTVPLARVPGAVVGTLRSPGLYVAQGGGARTTIAVNVGEPQVSNLMRTTIAATNRASVVTAGGSSQPWWIYLGLAAFALALIEWWTWQRRITV